MRQVGLVLCGLASLCGTDALARPLELAARGPWNLNYADDRCTLTRAFGPGERPVFVQFVRTSPGDGFQLLLIGQQFARVAHFESVRIRFGTTGAPVRSDAMVGSLGKLPVLFLSGRLDNLDWTAPAEDPGRQPPAITAEQEAAIASLQVALPGQTLNFALGSLGKPMAALRTCTRSLMKSWGLDPAEQESLLHGPLPLASPDRWLVPADYPDLPLAAGEQAIIAFRLMIDATGQPTSCVIQSRISTDESFARTTCNRLMRRARFASARRADGTAAPSYFADVVRWVIP